MKLTEEMIDDIRNAASISEVIGHYIPLIRKGKGYTALCPFHDDHDPSLSISEDKQIYKCFVCGKGGNVFRFVQDYKKVSFPEAVKEVSEIIGKPIDIDVDRKPRPVSKYQRSYDLLNAMISYSSYLLTASKYGPDAMAYLEKRGLEKDIIERFDIGYDPNDTIMTAYLKSQKFTDEEMIRCNVGRLQDNGMRDVFHHRILFPIHNENGEPVAFSARDFEGRSDAKYINSSETEIYTKGDIIYNYHRAKDAARMAKAVIVCEGVMDVIAYARAGIDNCVATLGTACTQKQLDLIASLSNDIVVSYDGDRAGQAANMKIGELAMRAGYRVYAIDNRSDLDPDELINTYGKNTLRDLYSKKVPFLDYAIRYYREHLNLENYNDRKTMTIKVGALIDLLKDEYDRENYTNTLYEITKLRKRDGETPIKKEYNRKVAHQVALDGLTKAEYTILLMMAYSLQAVHLFQKDLGCLLDDNDQKLAMAILDDYRRYEECSLARIYDQSEDEEMRKLIVTLATAEDLSSEYREEIFRGAMDRVKREIKQRKLRDLEKKIAKVSALSEEETNQKLEEYLKLVKELGGSHGKSSK
ncbi:MAG: DNA primase [Erysipelotrichaceae bacterium]|nr:DNA primase [Erysipelotrichaceae bacterium]